MYGIYQTVVADNNYKSNHKTMNKVQIGIGMLIIGVLVGVGGMSVFAKSTPQSTQQAAVITNTQSMTMSDTMSSMNAALQGKTGDAFDKAFLSEMIVHHQGAVAMAQLALQNANHTEIKQLAAQIILAQDKEISEMQGWQKSWYGIATSTSNNSMPGMQMGQ
jgi:hypothetical protein